MSDIFTVLALTFLAGVAMPVGALLACAEKIHPKWLTSEARHGIIAFGGGALLSAIALVLVPEGIESLSIPLATACFAGGGIAFLALDIFLDRIKSPSGQLVAMLSDFVPEAVALGASCATGNSTAILLASLIAIQNLPEGFNAYRELTAQKQSSGKKIILAFFLLSLAGPAAGACGFYLLSSQPQIVSGMMLFASGGILYIVFQDIAPQARLKRRWTPALGAVLGFLLGMVGKMLVE